MTRDEILSMKPGRELDALVAEKVMGFRCVVDKGNGNVSWIAYGVYGETHTPPMAWKKWNYKVPPYSTDISAAFDVMEKLRKEGWCGELRMYDTGYSALFNLPDPEGKRHPLEISVIVGEYGELESPEAICKAALLAVMGE